MNLKDKVVLITGAGSGIGRETAVHYAQQGATVIISDVNEKGGNETVVTITEAGGQAFFIKNNVTDYEAVEGMITTIVEKYGKLDIAVNNAGIANASLTKTAESPLDDWHKVIAVNQTGVFYCMRAEIQQMMKQGHGSIINIASIAGIRGLPNAVSYVASKHAVVGMTKTAAREYAKHNIRINAVCPVFTITPLFQPQYFPGDIGEKLRKSIPMKRFSEPQEMAKVIMWLSSDEAGFVTGHAMPVDGGLTA